MVARAVWGCLALIVGLAGSAGAATMTTSIDGATFGSAQVGVTAVQTRTITISNGAATSPLVFTVSSDLADFVPSPASGSIAAGTSMDVVVSFTPTRPNARNATITVDGNDAANPSDSFSVSGIGDGALFTPTPTTLDFGTVPVGQFAELPLTITNTGNQSGTISSIVSGNGTFTFTVTGGNPPRTLAPAEAISVVVRFTPVTGAVITTNLSIATDGTPATLDVPTTGDGLYEAISIAITNEADSMVDLGNVRVGAAVTRIVTVTNIGETSTTLALPTSSATPCTVTPTTPIALPAVLAPTEAATFEITTSPTAVGLGTCTITITTTIPTTDTIVIDYVGIAPEVALTLPVSAAIHFGVLDVDSAASIRTVVVENTGTDTLAVGPCTIDGSTQFVVVTDCTQPLLVAPNGTLTITVAFDPSVESIEAGQLHLGVDALSTASVDVALTGIGADQRIDVSALAVSFPDTDVGATAPPIAYIDVHNPINATTNAGELLSISMATTDDSTFVLANKGPFVIDPDGMIRLAISFQPRSAGMKVGTLLITSDASADPMVAIALSGRAVVPAVDEAGGCCETGDGARNWPIVLAVVALFARRRFARR